MNGKGKTIWITGANGQVGSELRKLATLYPKYNFLFTTREDVPIHDAALVEKFLFHNPIDVCINAAAYTAVDLAEKEREQAMLINATAPGYLASACYLHNVRLIHISTDYVFDGNGKVPYKEEDAVDPVNFYGQTKLIGEQEVLRLHLQSIVVRTSWVYSTFGKNFLKTIYRLINERKEISVVNDQFGCPTYAADLANSLLLIAIAESAPPGIYHYCNKGIISWYDFAVAICTLSNSPCVVKPIATSQYPTPAKRPVFSALNTEKIEKIFHLSIPDWKQSLKICLQDIVH